MPEDDETGGSTAYDPSDHLLENLTDEQKQEIVDEVGERVVERLKDRNQEKFLRDLEGAVIGNLPFVGMSSAAEEGIRQAVRALFDEHTEEMIDDAGNVVVDRLVEAHSEEIVEDVIRTTSRKIRDGE